MVTALGACWNDTWSTDLSRAQAITRTLNEEGMSHGSTCNSSVRRAASAGLVALKRSHIPRALNENMVRLWGGGLPNGTVLIAGGQLGGGIGSNALDIHVPVTGSYAWGARRLLAGRHNHTATLLADGTALIAGGYTGWPAPTATAEVYK